MTTYSTPPSTPCRSPRRSIRHETVSPYFNRVLSTSSSPNSTLESDKDGSPISKKRSNRLKESDALVTSPKHNSTSYPGFIDDDTYASYGVNAQLLKDPLYAFNLRKFTRLYAALWRAKPLLIQERVADDPWKLLVAVMLLNKTAGKLAIPVFWQILSIWGTPEALSEANAADLKELIQPLGLHERRSKRMIELSKAYIADPPRVDTLRPTNSYLVPVKDVVTGEARILVKEKYPPTPASHLPGSGPYALDSYRIFCMPGDHWKTVMPADKELIKYMKWKWALFEQRHWDPVHGVLGPVDAKYLAELPSQVTLAS
ncbi:hypothetical protein SCHPADRAFT_836401 [Schizopora paradoxa]|uniref:HhH-GPD domain-containing protein n=1 Tax=Schizopora paradoxa TaxID=27342 RepID=A0A0H2RDM0_9AGAM|nr:hypothetical protein SCHPADRAFT_836401 [Schizopora paradoxa]